MLRRAQEEAQRDASGGLRSRFIFAIRKNAPVSVFGWSPREKPKPEGWGPW